MRFGGIFAKARPWPGAKIMTKQKGWVFKRTGEKSNNQNE